MQTKDLDTNEMLDVIDKLSTSKEYPWDDYTKDKHPVFIDDIFTCYPKVPQKLIVSKLRNLIKKGLITGCACGCRGDFEVVYNKGF